MIAVIVACLSRDQYWWIWSRFFWYIGFINPFVFAALITLREILWVKYYKRTNDNHGTRYSLIPAMWEIPFPNQLGWRLHDALVSRVVLFVDWPYSRPRLLILVSLLVFVGLFDDGNIYVVIVELRGNTIHITERVAPIPFGKFSSWLAITWKDPLNLASFPSVFRILLSNLRLFASVKMILLLRFAHLMRSGFIMCICILRTLSCLS